MHQSIPAAPSPLDGKFPGGRTLELSNPQGWGRKKGANALSFDNTATFFIEHKVEKCNFKHFNVLFSVSIYFYLCIIALGYSNRSQLSILDFINCAATTPVYGFNLVLKLLTLKLIECHRLYVISYVRMFFK